MKRPLVFICLSFAAGVFLADVFTASAPWLAAACAVLALSAVAAFFIFREKVKRYAESAIVITVAASVGVLWSWGAYCLWTQPALTNVGKQLEAEMLVTGYPEKSQYGWLVPAELFNAKTAFFTVGKPDARPGDTIVSLVKIGEYAYNGYTLKAVQAGSVEVRHTDRIPLVMLPARMRHELITRLKALFTRNSDFAVALLTGDRSGFSESFSAALSVSGLSHTVAISGLHVSFIVGIFIWLFGGMRRAAPFVIPVVLLFVAVVGFPPSAVRAAVMNILMLAALLINRDYDPRVSLSAALALILLVNPSAALDIGLQLSFAATLGLISFAGLWSRYVFEKLPVTHKFFLRWAVNTLSTTAAALVFTIPLTAYYFGIVSLAAPLSNLIALPAVSFLFIASLMTVGVSCIFPAFGKLLALCLDVGFGLLKSFISTIGDFSISALYVSEAMTVVLLVFQYAVLALCYIGWHKGRFRPVFPVCASVCALCAVVLSTALSYDYSNMLRVTAVDVGQGQSLVLSNKSQTVVVDCGGSYAGTETSKAVLSRGTDYIDALVLTHCHSDHMNGVETLMERVNVGVIVVFEENPELEEIAERTDTPILALTGDATAYMGDCELTLIVPRDGKDENERCLSVLANYNGFTMLVTGDMSGESERLLLRTAEIPALDLYVAGHHGSKYSTCDTLLYYTNPAVAIISAGANNYRHPAAETLARLDEYGIMVYRTDIHGNVTVTVGG